MTQRRPRMAHAAPLLAALLLALGAGAGRAQTSATGAIAGVVVDAAGEPLMEALITLSEPESGSSRSIMSDEHGRFRFSFLPPGDYTLALELLGYAPLELTGVPARPGRELQLEVPLEAVAAASPEPQVRVFPGAALAAGAAGTGQWLPRPRALPAERQELRDLARLSSWTSEDLALEGLPPAWGALLIDGTPFRPVRHPSAAAGAAAFSGFGLTGFASGLVTGAPIGPDYADGVGGVLSAHSLTPTRDLRVDGAARWSGDVLPGASVPGGDVPAYLELHGALSARGSSAGQSARFVGGVSLRSIERPLSAAWPLTETAAALLGEAAEQGADVVAYAAPAALTERAISGFGTAELDVAPGHRVAGSVHVASLPRVEAVDAVTGLGTRYEGLDVVASIALRSTFASLDNELRAAITSSSRESVATDSVPATFFVGEDLAIGSFDANSRVAETGVRITDAVSFGLAGIRINAGADVLFASHEVLRSDRRDVFFGSLEDLRTGTGTIRGLEGGPLLAEWSEPLYGVFAEARLLPLAGLTLRLGARGEREALPTDQVRSDTFANNTLAEGASWRVSPRLRLDWDLDREHRWRFDLDAGIHHDRFDPLLLAAWQHEDGPARIRRAQGAIPWPVGGIDTGTSAIAMLIPEQDFEAVRSTRVGAGLTHRLGAATALQLAGVIRSTKHLPRRTDLNLDTVQTYGRDQYGREVYGTLVQQGALLAAEPGTGRRFDEYDAVGFITSSGTADYWGVTLGLERGLSRGLALIARYTFSGATDDWFGAREGGWRSAAPLGLNDNTWVDATSDFDVPHRLVAGASLDAPRGVHLSALFRLESGLPFTPGFRYGVDANADGDFGNDPAFVDPDLPGMAELMAEWPCLNESTGRFAARNSCRGEVVTALDLAAQVTAFRLGRASASILLEAIDLLDNGRRLVDSALYLVDPGAALDFNPVTDEVTVPLLVNPAFGEDRFRRDSGRRFRVGVGVHW